MGYIKPIPVKRENIKVGSQYYTCGYSGSIKVTVIKIFDDGAVLVKTKNNKSKPFVRRINYIFDNSEMAQCASRNWEHDERKRRNK